MVHSVMSVETKKAIKDAVERLGKYDSLDDVPCGSNSYSYKAQHIHLQQPRFLKAIYLPKEDDELIFREPRALRQAIEAEPVSQNIVKLYDVETIKVNGDDYVLLQMELIAGDSLQEVIEKDMVGQQEAVRIAINILHGVEHLHREKLLHRDLKPDNILLDGDVPKIADFGSICRMPDDAEYVHASKHSDLYVPSEAWHSQHYTISSDLYQVGLILYQLVNGPMPTSDEHYLTKSVLRKLRNNGREYRTLSQYEQTVAIRESLAELTLKEKLLKHGVSPKPYYSPSIRRMIGKVTKADPSKRYSTAFQFLMKLTSTSTPDWKDLGEYYEAAEWKGRHWRIYQKKSKSGLKHIVKKAKDQAGQYQRCHETDDIQAAFKYVESQ